MGFAKTPDELDRYYRTKDREFPGATMLGVMFDADEALTRACLPPPLEQAESPGGLLFVAEYGDTNLGPGYREAALLLRCSYQGVPGSYCLSMPIDSPPNRLHNGRDIFGFPKKSATITLERDGDRVRGTVERLDVRFLEVELVLGEELPLELFPPVGPTYLFKASPRIDLEPGFDGPVLLASQRTEVTPRRITTGQVELTFQRSDDDPWADFASMTPTFSFLLESSNVMLPGEILGEVDPDAFLPHYFTMTDFFAGQPRP
jgi:acetoacetate decarboxylase